MIPPLASSHSCGGVLVYAACWTLRRRCTEDNNIAETAALPQPNQPAKKTRMGFHPASFRAPALNSKPMETNASVKNSVCRLEAALTPELT